MDLSKRHSVASVDGLRRQVGRPRPPQDPEDGRAPRLPTPVLPPPNDTYTGPTGFNYDSLVSGVPPQRQGGQPGETDTAPTGLNYNSFMSGALPAGTGPPPDAQGTDPNPFDTPSQGSKRSASLDSPFARQEAISEVRHRGRTQAPQIHPAFRSNPLRIQSPGPSGLQPATQSGIQPAPQPGGQLPPPPPYFKSRRVRKEDIQMPWLKQKVPRQKWTWIFPIAGLLIGLGIAAYLVWDGVRSVSRFKYCQVLNDDFSTFNDKVWTKEVEVGGFGNGQFEMTTNSTENVFVQDHTLWIKPTLQNPNYINTNYTLDLRGHGCTSARFYDCVTATNTTNGTIINPVKSGRVNTASSAWIKFGRVEVVAQLPAGDWMWPAIWMLPKNAKYGPWPRSGEIDIVESRGNDYRYKEGGNNIVSSTLHFGPNPTHDGWWRFFAKRAGFHRSFSRGYHTFGVEWTEKYIFTYIDTRLNQILYVPFRKPMWEEGRFPLADNNGTWLRNPWVTSPRKATPFDEDFYLVLDVAVGGTNGWFEDGMAGKPWIDTSPTAKKEFWEAREKWLPTWKKNGVLKVKSVKMWQQEGYNGCFFGSEREKVRERERERERLREGEREREMESEMEMERERMAKGMEFNGGWGE